MLFLACAACDKQLNYDAKRCSACKVRYCSKECQAAHWQNGHKKHCKKIARHGGVEKYRADVEGAKFMTAAVETCCGVDAPADAVCTICEQRGDEPILRACECSGHSGLAHLSCLVRRAQIARQDISAENDTDEAYFAAVDLWSKCPTCEKSYHKAVRGALGWACFKTYSSCAPTGDRFSGDRDFATRELAKSMEDAGFYQLAKQINLERLCEAEHLFPHKARTISVIWSDLAGVCMYSGEYELELFARREAYTITLALNKDEYWDKEVVWSGSKLAISLLADDQRTDALVREAHVLLRKIMPLSRRTFGPDHDTNLKVRRLYAMSLYLAEAASQDDVTKATNILEDVARTARRRPSCEQGARINRALDAAREKLASLETKRRRSTRTQAALEAAVLAM